MFVRQFFALTLILLFSTLALAQSRAKPSDKFRQLEEDLPTPNEQRTASGAPGRGYWQNRADYVIDVELDDANQRIIGRETVTYKNASPDTLTYLWLQLDNNIFAKDSLAEKTKTAPELKNVPLNRLEQLVARDFDGRVNIGSVTDAKNNALRYTINETMMRIDLPTPLASGQQFVFNISWNYNINNQRIFGGRTGYEYFPADGNYLYEIAHWFPRMAAYHDTFGWQHKQFLGAGEFTLEFGDYLVRITAPNDHVVTATGVLQNPAQVLTAEQRQRLKQAETAREPIKIITQAEATANEKNKPTGKKTWIFKGDNVRDFAFASSRKFIWDAQGHGVGANRVMAMSLYPKEGNPLWEKYSTHAIIHTLNVYSRYTFQYPYPVAISVNGPVGGMEYPMICFNGPRPEPDGTYSAGTKYGLISVVIHEVGHNYFPMIVNSDERQWTWMDEGLNSYLQFLAEQEWEKNYPSWRGEPANIVEYMLTEEQVPIMTNSDSALQFGNNAYGKPATALNILRETVMGRELFDHAFKTYAQRWQFKRPQPADFFRTMEDASAVDLDWFWRGWFYSTDHVDISIENIRLFQVDTKNPEIEKGIQRTERESRPITLSQQRNESLPKRIDQYPSLRDFYNDYDPLRVTEAERAAYQQFLSTLTEKERQLLTAGNYFYVVDLKNVGGLVMPLIFKVEYMDGTSEQIRVPVEIWRYNNFDVSKLIVTKKEARSIVLDPNLETGDANLENNFFPRREIKSRFQVFKQGQQMRQPNLMQQQQRQSGAQNTAPSGQQNVNAAQNLTGRWNITVDAPGQPIPLILNLTQTGGAISGTVEGAGTSNPITNATLTADGFSFKTILNFQGQQIEVTMNGRADGN
ncbi:MAG TPA: M1 family metallopeptidase, partial [Pyrinomonadaceae bacterium]|nr:M1 family metallopeptidase [Pyrinomonadaceae bacterium]